MIHIIGDSHVSFFSGTTYMQPTWPCYVDNADKNNARASYIKGVRQYRLGPLTAYNFEKNASGWVQDILSLENIENGVYIIQVTSVNGDLHNGRMVKPE